MAPKGRVVFLLRLKPGMQEAFLRAYEASRRAVAEGVPGHLVDQLCQAPDDPDQWVLTSEWESLAHFLAWERSAEHPEQAKAMRACWAEARSLKFEVVRETAR
jgi:heme-degrading monooxygenase HmoA